MNVFVMQGTKSSEAASDMSSKKASVTGEDAAGVMMGGEMTRDMARYLSTSLEGKKMQNVIIKESMLPRPLDLTLSR